MRDSVHFAEFQAITNRSIRRIFRRHQEGCNIFGTQCHHRQASDHGRVQASRKPHHNPLTTGHVPVIPEPRAQGLGYFNGIKTMTQDQGMALLQRLVLQDRRSPRNNPSVAMQCHHLRLERDAFHHLHQKHGLQKRWATNNRFTHRTNQ